MKKIITLFLIIFSLACISYVNAESCYIQLGINESIINNSSIELSLSSQENLYGNYDGLVEKYDDEIPGNYILTVYDKDDNILGLYSTYTSLISYYDEIDNETGEFTGGIILDDKGIIYSTIPYNSLIDKIVISNGDYLVDLNIDPSLIKCERTCKIDGEFLSLNETCCSDFLKIQTGDEQFVCTNCGDGYCSSYENFFNCYEDCENIIESCGNNICDNTENCELCSYDCGICVEDNSIDSINNDVSDPGSSSPSGSSGSAGSGGGGATGVTGIITQNKSIQNNVNVDNNYPDLVDGKENPSLTGSNKTVYIVIIAVILIVVVGFIIFRKNIKFILN